VITLAGYAMPMRARLPTATRLIQGGGNLLIPIPQNGGTLFANNITCR